MTNSKSMKKIMEILDRYGINYASGNYHSYFDYKVTGHWIRIDTDLDVNEIEEEDGKYNKDKKEMENKK